MLCRIEKFKNRLCSRIILMLQLENIFQDFVSDRKKVFFTSLAILAASSYLKIDLGYIGIILFLIIVSLAFYKIVDMVS